MSGPSPLAMTDALRRRGGADGFTLGPLTLSVAAGSFTALTGRSGAGKTTLLQLAAGLDRVDRGAVVLFGVDVARAGESRLARLRRDHVGFVAQGALLIEHLPLWQNVALRLVPLGIATADRRARASEALARFGLAGKEDRLPRALSGGERQRAVLARATLTEPPLLVADEPTASVDGASGATIIAELRRRVDGGGAVLVASHDPALLAAADRRLELESGQLVP